LENDAAKGKKVTDAKLPPLANAAVESVSADDEQEVEAPATLVRVMNKCPRLLHLPDKIATSNGPEGPRIVGIGTGKSLVPGGNNVPRDLWEALKGQPYGAPLAKSAEGHKTVREWIRIGYLVEEGDATQPEGPEAPKNLLGYGVSTAQTLIEGEDDASILARWLKAENRPDVQAALKKRMQAVGGKSRN